MTTTMMVDSQRLVMQGCLKELEPCCEAEAFLINAIVAA